MKFAHIADVHFNRENADRALASLLHARDVAKREGVAAFLLSGDLFDSGIQNSDRDRFGELVDVIREMAETAPIAAIYGTRSHDAPGCYKVFEKIGSRFVVLSPGRAYGLWSGNINEIEMEAGLTNIEALLFGIPEPSKAWMIAGTNALGRDDASEQIKKGLKDILLGYGAFRKNYPSIPAILLYHGLVDGARASTGQVLTGDTGVSADDLGLAGCDYVACGHIHKAQRIASRSIYYAGSSFPVDWGETEQKQFNVVEIDKENKQYQPVNPNQSTDFPVDASCYVSVSHTPFQHPARSKHMWVLGDPVPEYPNDGSDVWLAVKYREGQPHQPAEYHLRALLDDGCGKGSRVTLEVIPTETVRAVEIQTVKNLREKLTVYAKASGTTYPESVYEKADAIEVEAKLSGVLPQPHAWRLKKVRTRGLKGIKRGMGLDEYDVDFDAYDPGLIALVAENGTGKTTLMTNCHFYPSMLIHDKKLQDYFCLRDSYREVYAVDDVTGIEYRGRMLVDGKNATGKAEYFLEYKPNGEWKPLASGKKEYEDKVTQLFGSEQIYIRSAFIPSKPSPSYPDLSYIPQGEKKRIFYELSGIGYFQAYARTCTEEAKALREEIAVAASTIAATEGLVEHARDLAQKRILIGRDIAVDVIEKGERSIALAELKLELADLEAKAKANAAALSKIDALDGERKRLGVDVFAFERKRDRARAFALPIGIESVAEIDVVIARHAELVEEKNRLEAQKNEVDRVNLEMKAREQDLRHLRNRKEFLINQIGDFEKMLEKKETCPKCGHKFAHDQARIEAQIRECQEKAFEIDKEIEPKKKTVTYVAFDDTRIKAVEKDIAAIDVAVFKRMKTEAETVARDLADAETNLKALAESMAKISGQIAVLKAGLVSGAVEEYENAKEKAKDIEYAVSEIDARISGNRGQEQALTDEIESARARLNAAEEVKKQIDAYRVELRDWEALADACGIDGIPALELDAVAPEISAEANALLEDAYGQRFKIEFRTTRIAGAGSKKKQVEDFSIWISDAGDGWTQPYETLSGGEETWIKKAIADAFEIIKSKNTCVKMLTVFQDEVDGKLSPHNKQVFFKLLERTHAQTGRHHTVVVTHSEAAQEQIRQRIELRKRGE